MSVQSPAFFTSMSMGVDLGSWLVPEEYQPLESPPPGPMDASIIESIAASVTSSGAMPANEPWPERHPSRQSPHTPLRDFGFLAAMSDARSVPQGQFPSWAQCA